MAFLTGHENKDQRFPTAQQFDAELQGASTQQRIERLHQLLAPYILRRCVHVFSYCRVCLCACGCSYILRRCACLYFVLSCVCVCVVCVCVVFLCAYIVSLARG
jgi:hypothetical protein